MIYEVTEARLYTDRLTELLREGWEPFAVIAGAPPGQNDRIVLRRGLCGNCGHPKDDHLMRREDDYKCARQGCACPGFKQSQGQTS